MLRPLAALLVFALPLSAAPVPKALKKRVPQVAGTVWVGEQTSAELSPCEITFAADGGLTYHYPKRQQTFTDGFWEQDGATLTWHVNNRYATYTLTFKDGQFEGTANNIQGATWGITIRPKEK